MTDYVKVSGYTVLVLEDLRAKPGDRLLIVNGKCLGLYTAEVRALPAPAKKATGRPAGRGVVQDLAFERLKKWGPVTSGQFADKSGLKTKEARGASRATLVRLVTSGRAIKRKEGTQWLFEAKESS